MGTSQSVAEEKKNADIETKFSDKDIKERIDKLFLNNRCNPVSENTIGTQEINKWLDTEPQTKYSLQKGGQEVQPKLKSRRNRFDQYDIMQYIDNIIQNGGEIADVDSDTYNQISDISEFQKIRDYLKADLEKSKNPLDIANVNDINNPNVLSNIIKQQGGFNEVGVEGTEDLLLNPNSPNSPATEQPNKFSFLSLLKGGASRTNDDEVMESETSKVGKLPEEVKKITVQENIKKTDLTKKITKESEEKKKVAAKDDDEDEEEEDDDDDDDEIDIMNDDDDDDDDDDDEGKDKTENINGFSETSFNSRSSNINILPFYSTSTASDYSFKHPYIKNRFN